MQIVNPMLFHAHLAFRRIVAPLIFEYDGSEISGIRSEKHNREVGGKPNSLHLAGCASDVQFETQKDKEDFAVDAISEGLEVVVKHNTVHVEMDVKSWLGKHVDRGEVDRA